jgi:threonine dehydrogenase-like Zn-dependent dehydrogenase
MEAALRRKRDGSAFIVARRLHYPKENKASHCGICGTDLHLFRGEMDHRVKVPQNAGAVRCQEPSLRSVPESESRLGIGSQ